MDTKLKNLIEKTWEYVIGIIFIVAGVILESTMEGFWYVSRSEMHFFWFAANVFMGIGIVIIMRKKFEEWTWKREWDYQEWKKNILYHEKIMWIIGGFLLVVTFLGDIFFGGYLWNVLAVLVQFIICLMCFRRFLYAEFEKGIEQMEEISRAHLQNALEIERKSMEKVSRSDQLRMDLITNVSHDLKTPLTSMVGYLELVKREELSDTVKDYIDVIVDKTDKLKEMINSLFSLAKVSSGNIELHMETFSFNRLIEQIMSDMRDRIDESELSFVEKLTEESTEIVSDNMYCYRICQNLLENALKYSAKGTRVFVKTYIKENENLCFEMTNTAGYFMDFEKEEILEKFARGDKARSTEGNGLGLAIVSSYVKALGGEFDIQIDCDQFKVYLILPKSNK